MNIAACWLLLLVVVGWSRCMMVIYVTSSAFTAAAAHVHSKPVVVPAVVMALCCGTAYCLSRPWLWS